MMPTIHDLKIDGARACIREHLSHFQGGARCYATRAEALDAARDIITNSEQLDGWQINEAFEPFIEKPQPH